MSSVTRAGTRATPKAENQRNYNTLINVLVSQTIIVTTYFFAMKIIYPIIADLWLI